MTGRRTSAWRRRLLAALATLLIAAAAAGLIALYLANRGGDDDDAAAARPKPVAPAPAPGGEPVIALDTAAAAASGIALLTLKPAPQPMMMASFATVLDPAPLADLMQRAAAARAARDEAEARADAAAAEHRRDQVLFRDQHNVSAAALEAAAANDRAAAATRAGREADLRLLAAAASSQWGPVLGPDLIAAGSFAQSLARGEECLLAVGEPPHAPAEASRNPPAKAYATLAGEGEGAQIEFGLVSRLSRVDPRSQAPLLLYAARCGRGALAGMNLAVTLPGPMRPAALRVPAEAVLWWQGRAWVYREIAPGRFARLAIDTDEPAPGGGFIIPAQAGNAPLTVVGSGAAALFSEEFRSQIQLGEGDSDP